MSAQRGYSPNTLELFQLFNNSFYRSVDTLFRDPSGQVYDPTIGPPPPRRSKKSKTSSSRPRGERVRREAAPEPEERGSSSRSAQENSPAEANWDQNVVRVFGPRFSGRWANFSAMVNAAQDYLGGQNNGKVDLKRAWRPDEFERAARLLAWGVDLEVIESLVGMPNKKLRPEEENQFLGIIQQEEEYLRQSRR
ncbi:hypothetical protein F53441_5539 [Fusarium austroafricanum]|uniref:Uncharacterized protein n=1 Tax=Fusarium austroafricanum TaxID=2364996 RepID=A0A8H4KHS4_9HYPO|nr:hypothetical protein F53441_5539 [Fusarium austroafricanum]